MKDVKEDLLNKLKEKIKKTDDIEELKAIQKIIDKVEKEDYKIILK